MPFPYKTVLITGATSGIGRALAERMLEAGIFVIAVGRRTERLDELVAQYGTDRVAAEPCDVADLDALGPWAQRIIKTYPSLDALVLNAGSQRSLDFTAPSTLPLAAITAEMTTNYLSPVHTLAHFLPHLLSPDNTINSITKSAIPPRPAAILLISSGLALLPLPRCANYSASKAALHSLAWSLRAQLSTHPASSHVKVIEILPPGVATELHARQPDLVRKGLAGFGVPLGEYADEIWAVLRGEEERAEILTREQEGRVGEVEGVKKRVWGEFVKGVGEVAIRTGVGREDYE